MPLPRDYRPQHPLLWIVSDAQTEHVVVAFNRRQALQLVKGSRMAWRLNCKTPRVILSSTGEAPVDVKVQVPIAGD